MKIRLERKNFLRQIRVRLISTRATREPPFTVKLVCVAGPVSPTH